MKKGLFNACRYGNIAEVTELIDAGIDINAKNRYGWTGLMIASEYNHKEICDILLSKGADVNTKTQHGWTALLSASHNGSNYELCKLLIDNGADVNATYCGQFTPLMASYDNKSFRDLLIEKGANVNARDLYGRTIFTRVILNGIINKMKGTLNYNCEEVCKCLIDNGAEVSDEDLENIISLGWTDLCFKIIENRSWERRKHMIAMFKHVRKL